MVSLAIQDQTAVSACTGMRDNCCALIDPTMKFSHSGHGSEDSCNQYNNSVDAKYVWCPNVLGTN